MRNVSDRLYTMNLNFATIAIAIARYKSRDSRRVWIKWSGNHFAARNATESGVIISGRIVSFSLARGTAAGLNGNSGVPRGMKIITRHSHSYSSISFSLSLSLPSARAHSHTSIHGGSGRGRVFKKKKKTIPSETRPRIPSRTRGNSRQTWNGVAPLLVLLSREVTFQGSSYFFMTRVKRREEG